LANMIYKVSELHATFARKPCPSSRCGTW
jgi:hypothetical protein